MRMRVEAVALGGEAARLPAGALCTRQNPALFFPEDAPDGDTAEMIAAAAKAVCGRCPIRVHCLEAALADRRVSGIWGGTTSTERDAVHLARRRRARADA